MTLHIEAKWMRMPIIMTLTGVQKDKPHNIGFLPKWRLIVFWLGDLAHDLLRCSKICNRDTIRVGAGLSVDDVVEKT